MKPLWPVLALLATPAGAQSPESARSLIVPMTLAERPVRVRIDPAATAQLTCNPNLVKKLGLATEPGQIDFGGVVKTVLQAWAPVRGGARDGWQWIVFADRDRRDGAECEIGPDAFADRVLDFPLRPAEPGEREVALPWTPGKDARLADYSFGALPLGGEMLRVRFDPRAAESFATAAAARIIAASNGGEMSGARRDVMIAYGVTRPVRELRLATPLSIGPLAIDHLPVRVQDWGSTVRIPEAGKAAEPDDDGGGEVQVTARTKPRRLYFLRIGRDWLDRCSRLTYDGPRGEIRLSCR